MLNIADLCKTSHEISKEKGWLDNPRPFYTLCSLMQSEISEALEDYRANHDLKETYYECVAKENDCYGDIYSIEQTKEKLEKPEMGWTLADFKPCGIPIEIADLVIRLCQWAGTHDINLAATMELMKPRWTLGVLADFERVISLLNRYVSLAEWSDTHANSTDLGMGMDAVAEDLGDPVIYLATTMHLCWAWAETNGVDLDAAIKEKEAFNRTRPTRHGGKKI